jgi:hypothetical protein
VKEVRTDPQIWIMVAKVFQTIGARTNIVARILQAIGAKASMVGVIMSRSGAKLVEMILEAMQKSGGVILMKLTMEVVTKPVAPLPKTALQSKAASEVQKACSF